MISAFGQMIEIPLGEEGKLPTEFLILRGGLNEYKISESEKGTILFDDVAARDVMAAYAKHGMPVAIDLQHDSINPEAIAHRADAADARGWCDIEMRGVDLWACSVTWTSDGKERLLARKQRFISPVVFTDRVTFRAKDIFNLALVAQPALHNQAPLVASRAIGDQMDPDVVKEALEALIAGDADACAEILKKLIAGEDATADADSGGEALKEAPDADKEEKEKEKEKDVAALSVALRSALKVDNSREVLAEVKRMRSEIDALQLSRSAEERNDRIALVGELVVLGAELPATAWSDSEKLIPSPGLAAMSLSDLKNRVELFRAAPRAQAVRPPARGAGGVAALSDLERARADEIENPAAKARFVAARLARAKGRNRG